jgi:hypothetical protein
MEDVLAEHKRVWLDMYNRFLCGVWGLPINGYAENGKTAYPKQWFKDGNV